MPWRLCDVRRSRHEVERAIVSHLSVLCRTVLFEVHGLAVLSDLLEAMQPSKMLVRRSAVMSGTVCMDKCVASVSTFEQGNLSFDQNISSPETLAQSGDASLSLVNPIPVIRESGLEGGDFAEIFAFSVAEAFPALARRGFRRRPPDLARTLLYPTMRNGKRQR